MREGARLLGVQRVGHAEDGVLDGGEGLQTAVEVEAGRAAGEGFGGGGVVGLEAGEERVAVYFDQGVREPGGVDAGGEEVGLAREGHVGGALMREEMYSLKSECEYCGEDAYCLYTPILTPRPHDSQTPCSSLLMFDIALDS